ncbi:PEP-CTERM sorting domain-containing protein [Roseateles sp. GG27B]
MSGEVAISFAGTQDANVAVSQFAQAGSTFTAQTNHNGSATFNIPEPTSLALVGLALFGLGVARRRNSK